MSIECSVCGVDCSVCNFFNDKTCAGCDAVQGRTFWALEHLGGACPIYDCAVNLKNLKSCAECDLLPCEIYFKMKDPAWSEEEHLKMIDVRVNKLKSISSN
ncbi:MAG: DUF3795 domain-containing protein [Candidatus Kapabacteria bacterium]|nr:DUF3795 domain-containing protein [Candidatus Kapabacteria bacterium]